ncbi:MAG: entericidin, EcnA/B family [Pseudomonadota bacterium]
MVRIALVTAVLALSACETVKGVGRDITRTAEAVDGAFL